MKVSKLFTAVVVASAMFATIADAGSIGRSGGGGGRSSFSSSSSSSRSSSFSAPSRPSTPSVAPAPSKPGGIGGNTQGSAMGVRKSEVTAPVAQQVRPNTANSAAGKPGSYSAPAPTYGSAPAPGYSPGYAAPAPSIGGGFGSSFAGALGGSILGNMLFSNHGSGGTTVVNNGGGSGGYSQGSAPATVVDSSGQVISQNPVVVQQKESMSMGSIILNVILFAILIALLVGIAILFYKGFKMLKEYINKERGVSNQPFSPTARFWEIQRAFAAADMPFLKTLLGPDLVDEATNGLEASTVSLSGVSHEVRLHNNTEFSIWYTFTDAGEQVNQIWHYEKFGKDWLLNGIETV